MRSLVRALSAILLCVLFFNNVFARTVDVIRVSSATQRLVLEVNEQFKYRSFTLDDPHRLVIDILDAKANTKLKIPNFSQTPIKHVRTGVRRGSDLRLVFDLREPINKHDFVLMGQGSKPSRLVIDWLEKKKAVSMSKRAEVHPMVPLVPPEESVPKSLLPQQHARVMRDMIIVIDPGHGGKDPGATGRAGTHEKDVVLKIARLLKENLDKMHGVKTMLTRRGDYYVPLRNRLDVARNNNADLFVSIHADAYRDGSSNGASIYALSPSGASSEVARWIADRENYSELGGVDLNELKDSSDVLRTMLLDLSQTATTAASVRLGESLLKQLSKVVSLHKSKVEQAPFVVLKSPDIPSILVELGFISNHREERQLRSYLHQRKLAKAVSKGIFAYAQQHAPMDTFFAEHYRKPSTRYAAR